MRVECWLQIVRSAGLLGIFFASLTDCNYSCVTVCRPAYSEEGTKDI